LIIAIDKPTVIQNFIQISLAKRCRDNSLDNDLKKNFPILIETQRFISVAYQDGNPVPFSNLLICKTKTQSRIYVGSRLQPS
jgi:hypothetical protein